MGKSKLERYNDADEAQNAELAARVAPWATALTAHRSDRGLVHSGSRETCVSIDCLPPMLGVREGDVVHVVIPDEDVDGEFLVTTEPTRDAYTVTLTLTPRNRVP